MSNSRRLAMELVDKYEQARRVVFTGDKESAVIVVYGKQGYFGLNDYGDGVDIFYFSNNNNKAEYIGNVISVDALIREVLK